MASFPGSVKTFAVRSNGQTIADTWFNDADDEITAIEDGLRNGTAPLNSSNSTFAALNVTGLSTFAGNVTLGAALSVAGNSTIAGSLVVSSNVTVSSGQFTAVNQPAWNVYSTTVQTGTAGSTLSITFESELVDQGGFHSTAATTDRLTVPAGSSGLYLIGVTGYYLTLNSGFVYGITKNSSREIRAQVVTTAGAVVSGSVTHVVRLDAGDIVRFEVQGPASTWSVGNAAVDLALRCWGVKVS